MVDQGVVFTGVGVRLAAARAAQLVEDHATQYTSGPRALAGSDSYGRWACGRHRTGVEHTGPACIHVGAGRVRRRLEDEMAVDPVCGMQVDEENAAAGLEYEGEAYYFCSRACLKKFEDNPSAYTKKAAEE